MLTIDRVLTFVDPSAPGLEALDQALTVADRCAATVHVLAFPSDTPNTPPSQTQIQALVTDRTQHLAVQPSVCIPSASDGPSPVTPESLLTYAQSHEVDLIIADTPADRGRIPVLASASLQALAEDADIPLFVVAHHGDASDFRRILVPTDFSDHAVSAFKHAKELAALYDASIDVLHVLERPQYVALNPTDLLALSDATLPERNAQRRLDALIDTATGPSVPVRTHLRHGDAADQVCHFVDEQPVDLVVLSTHGAISRRNHPLGNVADKVLRRVTAPIFLTRAFGRSLVPPSVSA
jgi:nucleotide-binding universal stress UspA family protein